MNTHEFGGNGFDEPQIGLPGNRHLDRVIQESGLVMNLDLSNLFGGDQTDEQNKAVSRQYKYDVANWNHDYGTYIKERDHQLKQNRLTRKFNEDSTLWKERTAVENYNQRIAIQNYEFNNATAQYNQAETNYKRQLGFNNLAAGAAHESQLRAYEETQAEQAFQRQEQQLEALIQEGDARARGVSGRGAAKIAQTQEAALGRNIAIMDESMKNATEQFQANLKKIATDKYGADLAAEAKRMIEPGRKPAIPRPRVLPRTKVLDPILKPKGPRPERGARYVGPGLIAKATQVVNLVGSVMGLGNPNKLFS